MKPTDDTPADPNGQNTAVVVNLVLIRISLQ